MAKLPEFINVAASFDPDAKGTRIVGVSADLERGRLGRSTDLALWSYIRRSVGGLAFQQYQPFIDFVLAQGTTHRPDPGRKKDELYDRSVASADKLAMPFIGVERYRLLKAATEVFLMMRVGVLPGKDAMKRAYDTVDDPNNPLPNDSDDGLTEGALKMARNDEAERFDGLDVAPSTDVLISKQEKYLPYLSAVLRNLGLTALDNQGQPIPFDPHLQARLVRPMFLELIWSYWHEEGMLVQAANAITLRFQNRRQPGGRDPLAGMDLDPLRPMSNLLWGYVQDLPHWLTIPRRAYEYDHHYGLRLEGRAVPPLQSADSRSQFVAAFHELLYRTCQFYREDDNTIVKADPFPMLNVLKDLHVVLSEGAHNQYGDLPTTARAEMLIQMYLLGRPEIREFLGGRPMVAYPEPWMDRVDSVKKMLGWSDVSVIQFHDLATFGELLLLSVRFGNWLNEHNPSEAATWARYWRAEVQGYVHAYHAVTGVDLSADVVSVQDKALRDALPSVLMRQRLQAETDQRDGNGAGQFGYATGGALPMANGNGAAAPGQNGGVRRLLPLPPRFGPTR